MLILEFFENDRNAFKKVFFIKLPYLALSFQTSFTLSSLKPAFCPKPAPESTTVLTTTSSRAQIVIRWDRRIEIFTFFYVNLIRTCLNLKSSERDWTWHGRLNVKFIHALLRFFFISLMLSFETRTVSIRIRIQFPATKSHSLTSSEMFHNK